MDKILVVDNVSKEYPGRFAVKGISFEVKKGSIHGFLGPNGAGKSTTMKMISGLTPVSQGKISLFGQEVSPDKLSLKNQLGFLPENPPLYLDMSVENYLRYVAKIHQVTNVSKQLDEILTSLHLGDVRHRLIGNLSKGFKQRVGLAQAIIYDAPFLILDEPTSGLDPQSVVEFREFIKKLSIHKTILFSSHILSEVEQLCDHITIIHQGKIRATGDIHEMRKKFKRGFVIKLGLGKNESLPDLSRFGKYSLIEKKEESSLEDIFKISFERDEDPRAELGAYLIKSGVTLLTLQSEPPELEDIFLHMTETKNDL